MDGGGGSVGCGEVPVLVILLLICCNTKDGLTVMFSLPATVNEDDDDDEDNTGDFVAVLSERAAVLQTLPLPLCLPVDPHKGFVL